MQLNHVHPFVYIGILAVIALFSSMLWMCNTSPPATAHTTEEFAMDRYEEVRKDLIAAEGLVMEVYRDSEGYLTAGIGHRLTGVDLTKYKEGSALTEQTVETWFVQDYRRTVNAAEQHFGKLYEFPNLVQLAIVNWIYQLGPEAPEKFPRATEYLKQRKWSKAADEWEFADPQTHRFSEWRMQTPHRCMQEVGRLRASREW